MSKEIEARLEIHMTELVNWSRNIQIYGMSSAKNTDDETIELQINQEPRKFRGVENNKILDEISIIQNLHPYILLGDPGAGKTTTLKRIVRKMILCDQFSEIDIFQYPIVIRLRDLPDNETLHYAIATKIGLLCHCHGSIDDVNSNQSSIGNISILIGDTIIENALPDFLDNSKALILLDGLDEVNLYKRDEIEKEIIKLSTRLNHSKVIVSCRSGGYTSSFTGFNIVEICPLTPFEIEQISKMWAEKPGDFLLCLESKPYYDLANRPLFLIQLIMIFNRCGSLPEQPSSVYKKIINFVLEEWDERRQIKRTTKYANFDAERKLDFLSAISMELTIKKKKKVFNTGDLIQSYYEIYRSFNLPKNEAIKVINEIETHNGIIFESGFDNYEFSHLSIQEYLCAYYLVRESVSQNVYRYLSEYPSPVAISVSISSDPSMWFGTLILNEQSLINTDSHQLEIFLNRLVIERPFFNPKIILGLSLLKIFFYYSPSLQSYIFKSMEKVVALDGVKESIAMCLPFYKQEKSGSEFNLEYCYLKRASSQPIAEGVLPPQGGFFPINLL
ncbi:MAG: NACHT domain-containing protein [Desulfobulbaceae bacterium]|nr:NACHT domain-containing protein [Desulfobulbaceae bacterium]